MMMRMCLGDGFAGGGGGGVKHAKQFTFLANQSAMASAVHNGPIACEHPSIHRRRRILAGHTFP